MHAGNISALIVIEVIIYSISAGLSYEYNLETVLQSRLRNSVTVAKLFAVD